jgi:predicted nucleic acid-binding protein
MGVPSRSAEHQARVRDPRADGQGTSATPRRAARHAADARLDERDGAHDVVRELARLTVAPLDADTTLTAITVAQEHRIAFWDAQIVVAAARSGCDTLLSEDLNHGQRILDVETVNPFQDDA